MITRALTTEKGLTLVVNGREHTATWDQLQTGEVCGPFRAFTEPAKAVERRSRRRVHTAAAAFNTGLVAGALAAARLRD